MEKEARKILNHSSLSRFTCYYSGVFADARVGGRYCGLGGVCHIWTGGNAWVTATSFGGICVRPERAIALKGESRVVLLAQERAGAI